MNRRTLLGAAAAVPATTALPTLVNRQDAELLAAVEEYVAFVKADRAAWATETLEESKARSVTRYLASAKGEPSTEEVFASRIALLVATTPAGLRAKARALNWFYGGSDEGSAFGFRSMDMLLGSLLSDLAGDAA